MAANIKTFNKIHRGASTPKYSHRWALAALLLAAASCDAPSDPAKAPRVVAGAAHACAYDKEREQVVCWGDNSFGQLGNNAFSAAGSGTAVQTRVVKGQLLLALAAGHSHTCAIVDGKPEDNRDNTVACWGYNHYGQLGDGTFTDRNVPIYVTKADGSRLKGVVSLSTGAYHTCATTMMRKSQSDPAPIPDEGEVYCWGRNDKGQIGNGSLEDVAAATAVQSLGLDEKKIAFGVVAGTAHSCTLVATSAEEAANPRVYCWGDAGTGQFLNVNVTENSGAFSTAPLDIGLELAGIQALYSEHVAQSDLPEAEPVAAAVRPTAHTEGGAPAPGTPARGQTCARTADSLVCWAGSNQFGTLGVRELGSAKTHAVKPAELKQFVDGVTTPHNLTAIADFSVGSAQTCLIGGKGSDAADNQVACWGYSSGLGFDKPADSADGVTAGNRHSLVYAGYDSGAPQTIGVGREFACYTAGGDQPQIWCWGRGDKGQLGNNKTEGSRTPVCVQGYCPTDNRKSAAGAAIPFEEAPGAVPAFVSISVSKLVGSPNCATSADRQVFCWGTLGYEYKYEEQRYPSAKIFPTAFKQDWLSATRTAGGTTQICGLTGEGSASCRTYNTSGDDTLFEVTGLAGASAIDEGIGSFCAVVEGGKVRCWGLTGGGTFLPITAFYWPAAVEIAGIVNATEVGVGSRFACALSTDGVVRCWGIGEDGRLGREVPARPYPDSPNTLGQFTTTPAPVEGLGGTVKSIDVGTTQACAVLHSGSVQCWGLGYNGIQTIEGMPTAPRQVAIGSEHKCVLTDSGHVHCWGNGEKGQLGHGSRESSERPVQVANLSGVSAISSGSDTTCALTADGSVWCWGAAGSGNLGNPGFAKGYSEESLDTSYDPPLTTYRWVADHSSVPLKVLIGGGDAANRSLTVSGSNLHEGARDFQVTVAVPTATGDVGYRFDCDGDGAYEFEDSAAGVRCDYAALDSGVYKVAVESTTKILDSTMVNVHHGTFTIANRPPVINAIEHDPARFVAGGDVAKAFRIASVSATDPADVPAVGSLIRDPLTYHYDCNLNGVLDTAEAEDGGAEGFTCDLSAFGAGTYTLKVFVRDDEYDPATGNGEVVKPITLTITSLNTALDVKPGAYSGADVAFEFSSAQTTTVECKLDDAAYAVCTSPKSYTGLADGSHTFYARAVSGGAADPTPSKHTWIIDTIAPVTVIDSELTEPVIVNTVQVDFSAVELNPGTFWCNLNGLGWAACTSGSSFGPVAEGTHSLEVTAVDAAGNADLTPEIAIWSYWIPPETAIGSGPAAGGWSAATTTFTFSSATATGFECSLDSAAFSDCTSPHVLSGLGEGSHTFEVRAVRNGVPDATPASRTWTVDTIAPDTAIDTGPAATVTVAQATLTFSGTGGHVGFLCSLDGAEAELCFSPKVYNVAEGEHTVEITAVDAAGNLDPTPATHTWRYVIEPDTTLEAGLAVYSGTTTSIAFSSATTDVFQCNFNDGGWSGCTSPYINNSLTAGSHTLQVRAVKYGVPDPTPASHTWTAYAVPETVIDTPAFAYSGATTQIAFSSPTAGGTLFVCRLNSAPFVDCSSPKTLSALTPGSYTFEVSAYNPAGFDPSAASISWTVRNLPTTTILSDPGATSGGSVTFTFSGTDVDRFECSMNGGAYTTCTSPKDYTGLTAGSNTFRVRAVNLTGADATPAEHTWDVLALPETTIDSGPVTDSTSGVDVSFAFSSADGSATFECSLDGAAYAACTSPKDYTGLSEAVHVFRVRAVNGLGADDSPAVIAWTVSTGGGGGGGVVAQARSLATGGMHACAVTDGAMYCWGTNSAGQLGDVSGAHFNPSQMGTDTDWAMVAAGEFHTCGIKTTGKLWCWGAGTSGQLGHGLSQDESSPVAVAAASDWLTVVANISHTCAVRSDNTLWCWGDNSLGQLGQGTVDFGVATPVQVGSDADWADVVAGSGHSCGLKTDGTVYCWGMNSMGELGNGQTEDYPAPLTAAATEVTQITSGSGHVCVVKTDGTLWCWGDNFASQGGNSETDRTLASQVGTDTDWALVEAGVTHTCAIKTSGQLWCWGDQGNNALGDDASSGTVLTPAQTGTDSDWQALSCGQNFCIGHRAAGTYSWGDNMFNQCGLDGMFTPVVSPMELLTPYP